jgi:phosphohistidine phosphatase
MHQLILLRHAKAATPAPGMADHDRPLTEAGRNAATAMGKAMRKAGLAPEVVLVSTALRTQQTLECLQAADVWDEWPNIDTLPLLYMAPPAIILDALHSLPETARSALVIGHNPGLHELALALAGPLRPRPELARLDDGYPTCSLAEFMVAQSWRQLKPGGAALTRFAIPRDLS